MFNSKLALCLFLVIKCIKTHIFINKTEKNPIKPKKKPLFLKKPNKTQKNPLPLGFFKKPHFYANPDSWRYNCIYLQLAGLAQKNPL